MVDWKDGNIYSVLSRTLWIQKLDRYDKSKIAIARGKTVGHLQIDYANDFIAWIADENVIMRADKVGPWLFNSRMIQGLFPLISPGWYQSNNTDHLAKSTHLDDSGPVVQSNLLFHQKLAANAANNHRVP